MVSQLAASPKLRICILTDCQNVLLCDLLHQDNTHQLIDCFLYPHHLGEIRY